MDVRDESPPDAVHAGNRPQMNRRLTVQLIVWTLTAFFAYEMFHVPVRELLRRLAAAGVGLP